MSTNDEVLLSCLVSGNGISQAFGMNVGLSDIVDSLKMVIWNRLEKPYRVSSSDQLVLYTPKDPISLDSDDSIIADLNLSTDAHELRNPLQKISKNFAQPGENQLHVIVKILPMATSRSHSSTESGRPLAKRRKVQVDHDKAVADGRKAPAPSSGSLLTKLQRGQDLYPIHNGRPDSLRAPPLSIYHPVFAIFKDKLSRADFIPTPDTFRLAHSLCITSLEFYDTETERFKALNRTLSTLLNHPLDSVVHEDGSRPDGFVSATARDKHGTPITVPMVIAEFKNEIGGNRSEPAFQAAMSYRKSCVQEKMVEVLQVSCCPAFLMSIAGPHLMLSGAVLADYFIVQPLTDYIWLGGNPSYEAQLHKIAKVFQALTDSLETLEKYYKNLFEQPQPDHLFPYITGYGEGLKLRYTKRLLEDNPKSAIFEADQVSADGSDFKHELVVKFVETYCPTAHDLLAKNSFAPALHHYGPVGGGLSMVVMDKVPDAETFHDRYSDGEPIPDQVLQDIKDAVKLLHDNRYVFGDLRSPNLMVYKDPQTGRERGVLVDFDWCRQLGDRDPPPRYPVVLNDTGKINWHTEVVRGGVMRKEHDNFMLQHLAAPHPTPPLPA